MTLKIEEETKDTVFKDVHSLKTDPHLLNYFKYIVTTW